MIGELVGKYRIAEQIGEGGMGAVYRAEHVVLGSPAAIKVLLPQWTRNRQVVDRFLAEARAASAIRHSGIVQVFDAGRLDNGQAYIAMELLAGASLADLLQRRGALTPPLALAIGGQILAALDAAHVVGVIHRDLKPDNIQLVRDASAPSSIRVKLLDFGIAKLLFDAEGRRLPTAGGALLGTPAYMSPEQCGGQPVDARSDLYSVGCILFEMLTGRPPFDGETSADIVAQHLHDPPPLLRNLDPKLSIELEQLVSRMLDKDPEERTPSAAWALAALERAVLDSPVNEPTAVATPLVLAAMSAGPPALPGGAVALAEQSGSWSANDSYQPPSSAQYVLRASGQYGAAPASGQYGAAPASGQYGAAPADPASGRYGAASADPASGRYGTSSADPPSGRGTTRGPVAIPNSASFELSMNADQGSETVADSPLTEEPVAPRMQRVPSMMRAPDAEDFHHIDTGNETAVFAPVEDTAEQPIVDPVAQLAADPVAQLVADPALHHPPMRPPTPMMVHPLPFEEMFRPPPPSYGPLPRADWLVDLPAAPPVRRAWLPYVVILVAVLIAGAAVYLIARSAELPDAGLPSS